MSPISESTIFFVGRKETFSPLQDQDVHVTVSIGLAQYRPQEEMKAFVHRVDQLMYQGKKCGKDSVCSEPSLQT
jgi:PleD family two-component response regulator